MFSVVLFHPNTNSFPLATVVICTFKAELPPYYKPWMEIAQQIPELVNSKELRLHIDEVSQ